jgi:thioredoxin-related protein
MINFQGFWGFIAKILFIQKAKKIMALAALMTVFITMDLTGARAGNVTPTLAEDGMYHFDWYHQSFLEFEDDINEALAANKVLMVKIDQKGCIYCEKVAKEILAEPAINSYVRKNFMVVQLDLYGNRDVTDLDGTVMAESDMARRWGVLFTPTIYFISEPAKGDQLPQSASAVMPGAFGKLTFLGMLQWVKTGAYKDEPRFQKYFATQTSALRKKIEAARSN